MAESLFDLVNETFQAGAQLPQWQEILRDLEGQVLQFKVPDGEDMYVLFTGGRPELRRGVSGDPHPEVVTACEEVWRQVFEGRRRLVDAAWEGDLNARIYHGRGDLYYMISSFVKAARGIPELY